MKSNDKLFNGNKMFGCFAIIGLLSVLALGSYLLPYVLSIGLALVVINNIADTIGILEWFENNDDPNQK